MAILAHQQIQFPANGGSASGYLARPVEGGPYPGVVVIQEWWGLNPNICDIANRIAAEGYVALAPDLFHGSVTAEPDEAQKLMMSLQEPNALVDMSGAVAALQARDDVRSDRIGVTGFCLGGGMSLLLAMNNPAVTAAAPFYGVPGAGLDNAGKIQGAVMGFFAGRDEWINAEVVENLQTALDGAGVRNEIHMYPDSDHGFFNDTSDIYDPEAAADAWEKLKAFFAAELQG
ncbi:MAG: dienelactone hydrolase family protein [Chloroflexi bacterium]|nr:dienelactone hydrolase family protein [Chloroflexota bacterium]MYF22183.1 dienelactone hydrolase family protein [Chloroflexota bacterium]